MKMKFYYVFVVLFFGQLIFSQSLSEREEIIKLYNSKKDKIPFDSEKYSNSEKERTISKAKSLNIPVLFYNSDGTLSELVRFDGDIPLYYRAYNQGSAVTTRANLLYTGGGMGLSLSGNGMIAGVWDQNHPRLTHNDFKNSMGISRILAVDGPTAPSNHSTHVTGTVLSSGLSSSSLSGRGIAYNAEGWIFDWSNDVEEMNDYAAFGLIISNHSYGLNATLLPLWYFGAYVSDSNAVDNVCFNNFKYLPVYAAGNDRDSFATLNPTKNGNDLLSGDKTAKNGLVVGAVAEVLNYLNPSSVLISNFSSYGPTDDFRIKPDLVAKGINVNSTTFTSDTSYGFLSGTSMAAPSVTASLLLVQQFFGAPYLNASTLKGLAIHTADEAGPETGPDHMFGWGLLNTAKMVEVLQERTTESIVEERVLNNSQSYVFNVLALGTEPLKVSVSWTDRPGGVIANGTLDSNSPRLINDLDVKVTKLGVDYLPWKLNKDWDNLIAVKGDNNVDPLERVDIDNPSGIYQVTVNHKNTLVGGSQNYSLIVTGIDADANLSFDDNNEVNDFVWVSKNSDKLLGYSLLGKTGPFVFNVFDVNGRQVYSTQAIENEGLIDLKSVEQGLYIVQILTGDNQIISKKIVF